MSYWEVLCKNTRVKKYAATRVIKINAAKNAIMASLPELKIGEGGGCIIFSALERANRNGDFSPGPNNARRAITITIARNKAIGDLRFGIG
jgi:hypothetical protein